MNTKSNLKKNQKYKKNHKNDENNRWNNTKNEVNTSARINSGQWRWKRQDNRKDKETKVTNRSDEHINWTVDKFGKMKQNAFKVDIVKGI